MNLVLTLHPNCFTLILHDNICDISQVNFPLMALYQLNNYVHFSAIVNYEAASEVMWKEMVLIQSLGDTSLLCSEP